MKSRPIIERLMERVVVTDSGCWEFTGPRTSNGYGAIGREGGRGGGVARTHRVAYEYYVGPIPIGLDLDHLCRNRICCNPEHLEPVDRRTNLLRGLRKTRQLTCKHGHPFDGHNGRQRTCSTCIRSRGRKVATA